MRLIKQRGVSYVQASQDLGVHVSQLRDWVNKFADARGWISMYMPRRIMFSRPVASGLTPTFTANSEETLPFAYIWWRVCWLK